jgi:restriction system protein
MTRFGPFRCHLTTSFPTMAIPDFQTLMLPVLRSAESGEVKISDVVQSLADKFHLTQDERSELLPSGKQTTFANRVHWAKTHPGKAGLVELTRRAHFRITDRGRNVLAAAPQKTLDGRQVKVATAGLTV